MAAFPCPALGTTIALDDERERTVLTWHPEFDGRLHTLAGATITDPDLVDQRADRPEIGLVRFWPDFRDGCFVCVVVRADRVPGLAGYRYWVVTVYASQKVDTWKSMWER